MKIDTLLQRSSGGDNCKGSNIIMLVQEVVRDPRKDLEIKARCGKSLPMSPDTDLTRRTWRAANP